MSFTQWVYVIISTIGATILALWGGWDIAMQILVIFIAVDFIMGLLVAVTKRSPKTASGGLSSYTCFIGLCRKIAILLLIMISHALDGLLGTEFIRNAAITGFCLNELISIIENTGLLGLKLPPVIMNAVDLLKAKTEKEKVINDDTNE